MAKFRLWSDLHLENANHNFKTIFEPTPEDGDQILILAGDIDTGICAESEIEELCRHFKHVVRVPGNHEFYGCDLLSMTAYWNSYQDHSPKNYHLLYNRTVILDGVRIVGGTMWTGMGNGDPGVMEYIEYAMNDYRQIQYNRRRMTAEDIYNEHLIFKEFLLSELESPFSGKTVVATHHCPLNRHGSYQTKPISSAYFAELEDLISANDIALWVHGHVHNSFDLTVNGTRVVSNPRGYPTRAQNPGFNKNLVLTV